jgi:hypothetical protein
MVVGQTNQINFKQNSKEFWKTIKLVRKPNSHEPFPTVMEHEGKFVKTKQEIKHSITEYYKKLDNDNCEVQAKGHLLAQHLLRVTGVWETVQW